LGPDPSNGGKLKRKSNAKVTKVHQKIDLIELVCGYIHHTHMSEQKPNKLIVMPSEQKLRDLFAEFGMSHFVEKTGIIENLQGEKTVEGLAMARDLALRDYAEFARGLQQKSTLLLQSHMAFNCVIYALLSQ